MQRNKWEWTHNAKNPNEKWNENKIWIIWSEMEIKSIKMIEQEFNVNQINTVDEHDQWNGMEME